MKYYHDKSQPDCNSSPQTRATCYDIHSIDYGFPWHTKSIVEIYGTYYPETTPDVMTGTHNSFTGMAINFLFYFLALIIFVNVNKKGNPMWKIFFMVLFIVDAIVK